MPDLTIVDVTDWSNWERPDMALPYRVSAEPYGESIELSYATEAEARAAAQRIADLTGEYLTSWGMQAVNTVATISHYVLHAPPVSAYSSAGSASERSGYVAPCRIERTSLGGGVICVECGDECECVVCAIQDDDDECEGHESLNGADMGATVYCDGSCR